MVRIPPGLVQISSTRSDDDGSIKGMTWSLPRPLVRMPMPFCSMTESLATALPPGQRQVATPKFVNTAGGAAGSSTKERPQERVLISEVCEHDDAGDRGVL